MVKTKVADITKTCEETDLLDCFLCRQHNKCERETTLEPPKPYLEVDEEGYWSFKAAPVSILPNGEVLTNVVKFHATTRNCVFCGETSVLNRHFVPSQMHSVEGLACGHTVLITRRVNGLKRPKLNASVPKNWKHMGWRLRFTSA